VQQNNERVHGDTIASGPVKSQVVDYQPGEYSRVAFDDGREVMVSVAGTELWIFVLRARLARYFLAWVPSLLRKYPKLAARKTLLLIAPVRKADGNIARFREDDGTPLELGRTLLEVVTECLREHARGLEGRRSSSVASLEPPTLDDWVELSFHPQLDEHGLTPLSERDLQARLAFRKEIVRLHPDATSQQLRAASRFFGEYNPALTSVSFRKAIHNLSASDPFCQELEMHLKGPLPSWLCFPPSFWKELESLPPTERERRFRGRARELGIDLGEISDEWR
jgi:hypothetical protein